MASFSKYLCGLFVYISFLCSSLFAQELVWAKHLAGKGTASPSNLMPGSSSTNDVGVDRDGNVFLTGVYKDSVDFDASSTDKFILGSDEEDVYVVKYDSIGNFLWGRFIKSKYSTRNSKIELTKSGNVLLIGAFQDSLFIKDENGSVVYEAGIEGSYGSYLLEFDNNGNFVQGFVIDKAIITEFTTDYNGSIYIIGRLNGVSDFDSNPNTVNSVSIVKGSFCAKYDLNFQLQWVKSINDIGDSGALLQIKVSTSGCIYLAGFFQETVDFDLGTSVFNLTSSGLSFNADRFFAKYDTNANLIWVRQLDLNVPGTNSTASKLMIELDKEENIIVCGNFSQTIDIDASANIMQLISPLGVPTFITKYTTLGNIVWAKAIKGYSCLPTDIAINCGSIYLTGVFANTVDFDPSDSVANLVSNASSSFQFLASYDLEGNYTDAIMLGGGGNASYYLESYLCLYKNYQLVAAAFRYAKDFDPSPTDFILTSSGAGTNSFFAKYKSQDTLHAINKEYTYDNTRICEGVPFIINVTTTGATYLWQDNSTHPVYSISKPATYSVKITENTCSTHQIFHVHPEGCNIIIEMPNIFTPNEDLRNDWFIPVRMEGINTANINVYNRWGELLYQTDNLKMGWAGGDEYTKHSDGIYYWVIEYVSIYGVSGRMNGFVTLVR